MFPKYLKFSGIYGMLCAFLLSTAGLPYASMSMDEVKASFMKETGKKWTEVTAEERTDFMYAIHGREKKEEREVRVEGVVAPYHIREGFERVHKKRWEDATEEEQKQFVGEYKNLKKQWDKEEEARLRKIEQSANELRRKKLRDAQELKRKKAKREREKQKKARDLKKKRREEKKRLREAQKRRTDLLRRLKEMNKRHKK